MRAVELKRTRSWRRWRKPASSPRSSRPRTNRCQSARCRLRRPAARSRCRRSSSIAIRPGKSPARCSQRAVRSVYRCSARGIAATGDRLDVASALAAHGLPRPLTALCTSEDAGIEAVAAMGLPATLLPLDLKSTPIALLDRDAAEAVLEHRAVLGGVEGSLALIQAGSPSTGESGERDRGRWRGFRPRDQLRHGRSGPGAPSRRARRPRAERGPRGHRHRLALRRNPVVWDAQPGPGFPGRHADRRSHRRAGDCPGGRAQTWRPRSRVSRQNAIRAWPGFSTRGERQEQGLRRDLVISA